MSSIIVRPTWLMALAAVVPMGTAAQVFSASTAAERLEALQLYQCQVQRDVLELPPTPDPARDEAVRELRATKDWMHEQIATLEAQMDLAPELRSASAAIREAKLKEKILFSLGTVADWDDGSENRIEAMIQEDLAAVRSGLAPGTAPVRCAPA